MRKIYVDLTHNMLRADGPITGIPRCEMEYALRLWQLQPDRVQLVYWREDIRTFSRIPNGFLSSLGMKELKKQYRTMPCGIPFKPETLFEEGAILFVSGLRWLDRILYFRDLLAAVHLKKLLFVPLIHDIILARCPWFRSEEESNNFIERCAEVINSASLLLSVSQNTCDDVRIFACERSIPCSPIKIIRVGDIITDEQLPIPDLETFRESIGEKKYVLYVSSFNSRKNHILALRIWRKLVHENQDGEIPLLVFVGSRQTGADDTLAEITGDKKTGQYIRIFENIDDAQLDWLYSNCLFTIYPSWYEGWGAPVAESLAHGKSVIASDISSIPEIAPNMVDLVDPLDFHAWHEKVWKFAFDDVQRQEKEQLIQSYEPTSWTASARQILGHLLDTAMMPTDWPMLSIDERISDFRKMKAFRCLGGGWARPDRDGAEVVGNSATVFFRTRHFDGPLWLRLLISFREMKGSIRVVVNNSESAIVHCHKDKMQYDILLEQAMIRKGEFGNYKVELDFSPLTENPPHGSIRLREMVLLKDGNAS